MGTWQNWLSSVMPWLLITTCFGQLSGIQIVHSYVRDWKDINIVLCTVDQYCHIFIIFLELIGTI